MASLGLHQKPVVYNRCLHKFLSTTSSSQVSMMTTLCLASLLASTKCFKIFTKNWKLFMVFLVINVITIQLIQYFDKFCSTMTMNCTVEWTLKCQKTFQTFLNTLLFKATFLFFWNKETVLAFGLVLGNFRCGTIFC